MNRILVNAIWIAVLGLSSGVAYFAGHENGRNASSSSDLQIVQRLTEAEQKWLLSASADIVDGVLVSATVPGKSSRILLAKSKLDLPEKKPEKKEDPLNNPFKGEKPPKDVELVAYPCKVGIDSAGNTLWGVCYRRKF